MSTFEHYRRRCQELERELTRVEAERDQYFSDAEHYRCLLNKSAAKNQPPKPAAAPAPDAAPATGDPLMSRDEAAQYLGISPKTLATWATVRRYPLPIVKIGRRAMYRRADLDAFITRNTQ